MTRSQVNPLSIAISFAWILACLVSCKHKPTLQDYEGRYALSKAIPYDTSRTVQRQKAYQWTLELEDKNNFHLYGPGKEMVGYWNVMPDGEELKMILQGGGTFSTARFNGREIRFDQPCELLDRLFREAILEKQATP